MGNDHQIRWDIKNNHLKQWRNILITQQIQKKERMAKSDEDWNGLRYGFLKYCWAEQLSKLVPFAWNSKL